MAPIPGGCVFWSEKIWVPVDELGSRDNGVIGIRVNNISILPSDPSIQGELVSRVPTPYRTVAADKGYCLSRLRRGESNWVNTCHQTKSDRENQVPYKKFAYLAIHGTLLSAHPGQWQIMAELSEIRITEVRPDGKVYVLQNTAFHALLMNGFFFLRTKTESPQEGIRTSRRLRLAPFGILPS